jgi:hypothetical protein
VLVNNILHKNKQMTQAMHTVGEANPAVCELAEVMAGPLKFG